MDKEFWVRYLISEGINNVTKISDVLANFRLHADSKTQSMRANFCHEENSLFYQIAVTNDLDRAAKVIRQLLPMVNWNNPMKYSIGNRDLAQRALDYFLLNRADEFYYQNLHSKCSFLLSAIMPENLASEDHELYKKLRFRSAFVPVFIKRMSRRWK
jgi:hypothetical protein